MRYIGNTCHNSKIKIDEFIHIGMSAVDVMIAYRLAN